MGDNKQTTGAVGHTEEKSATMRSAIPREQRDWRARKKEEIQYAGGAMGRVGSSEGSLFFFVPCHDSDDHWRLASIAPFGTGDGEQGLWWSGAS
jgi:hypothetical protein